MSALLAITMGDACGIGPEIIAKLCREGAAGACVVLGDVAVMRRAAVATGGGLAVAVLEHAVDARAVPPRCIPVLPVPGVPADLVGATLGAIDARAGAAAARCIEHAVALVQAALGGQALELLLNTHLHCDHCGGNAALQAR